MYMINLLPHVSLQVQCYPECLEELRRRYKSTAAERGTQSRQWELFHCSIVLALVTHDLILAFPVTYLAKTRQTLL